MSAGLSILIADERASAHEAAILIERWGHHVKQSHDGLGAIEEARAFKPHLMLLGLSLPGLNGLGVASRLRKLPALDQTRFTALINAPAGVPRRELKKAGFSDTLVKPIVPLELLLSIVKTRDAIHRAQRLTRSAREIVARGKSRVELRGTALNSAKERSFPREHRSTVPCGPSTTSPLRRWLCSKC